MLYGHIAEVFLNGPILASFCLFLLFSHYNFKNTNWKKHRWCAWDLNPGPQDGRHRWNHGAMAATQILTTVCGKIDRAVTSDTREPRVRQIWDNTARRRIKTKEKRPGMDSYLQKMMTRLNQKRPGRTIIKDLLIWMH